MDINTSLCHIEVFSNKTQLDIVLEPFINVFACVLKHNNDSVRYFMSTESVSARCPAVTSPGSGARAAQNYTTLLVTHKMTQNNTLNKVRN